MENVVCDFCKKSFKNKFTLLTHKKTTKYCLEKQGIKNDEYKCEYCLKILTTHTRLISHIDICKSKNKNEVNKYKTLYENNVKQLKKYKELLDKKEKEYKELLIKKDHEIDIIKAQTKEHIQDLKTQLLTSNNTIAEIAKQPKSVNNNDNRIKTQNNIHQSFDINDVTRISNILEHNLTPDVLANGQKGLAEMLKRHLLQNDKGEPIYECTDVSRQKFEFVNKHGFLESDPKAAKLITSLNNANIFDVAHSTGKKLWETENGVNYDAQHVHMPKVTEVLDIKDDSTKFRSHLASIISR
jgi:hypothetical protein